eukprot:TRINITY_DN31635_c0_g1_i1.p1 TRINITY_DN31635_c0_g1~~TRINITY_DN31635_c0_g1_i1.p1  ORF type:complete len:204 (-),score=49.99 TRINITY_DN31635_c0_g1_i1:234-845(-)
MAARRGRGRGRGPPGRGRGEPGEMPPRKEPPPTYPELPTSYTPPPAELPKEMLDIGRWYKELEARYQGVCYIPSQKEAAQHASKYRDKLTSLTAAELIDLQPPSQFPPLLNKKLKATKTTRVTALLMDDERDEPVKSIEELQREEQRAKGQEDKEPDDDDAVDEDDADQITSEEEVDFDDGRNDDDEDGHEVEDMSDDEGGVI